MKSSTGDVLVSVVRTPIGLTARINRKSASAGGEAPGFRTDSVPLDQLRGEMGASKGRLRESWDFLSHQAKKADADALYHVAIVLLETAPDRCVRSETAAPPPLPPEWATPQRTVRPTAANPRAFRGTKFQPPKASQPPRLDLRPHVCDARMLRTLALPLLRLWDEVRPALAKAGYSESALEDVLQEMGGQACRKGPWDLPAEFVADLWPSVRLASARGRALALSLFVELDLVADSRLLAAFSRLLVLTGVDAVAGWADSAKLLPAQLRTVFLEHVLETGAHLAVGRPRDIAIHVQQVGKLASEEMFSVWIARLLLQAATGKNLDFLMAGYRLAAHFLPGYHFEAVGECDAFPEEVVEEIAVDIESEWFAMALWERCGELSGFADVIRESAWRRFSPEARRRYFNFLVRLRHQELSKRRRDNKWNAIRGELPRIEALILATPAEYQPKAIDYLEDWLWFWDDPAAIRRWMRRAYEILPRLMRDPSPTNSGAASLVGRFVESVADDLWPRVLAAPSENMRMLERACARSNAANSIARGVNSLIRYLPSFTLDALFTEPKKLAKTAEVLGGLTFGVRKEIVELCRADPLFIVDPTEGSLKDACVLIKRCLRAPSMNPIPARLSAWAQGEVALKETQIDRYRGVVAQRLIRTRLDLIEWTVIDRLKRGFPVAEPTASERHALRMLGAVDDNRRALRKFLKAYWAGDREYTSRHPATSAWYGKHPRLPRQVWEAGIAFPGSHVEGGSYVSITIEKDALEVLKLGTYVGSCLGLGGSFSYSAVAALLDANKKVIYARDQRGTVVARQLVAVSKDDRLVCFWVYPASTRSSVKRLFRDDDRAFADALGVALYQRSESGSDPYEIETVLAPHWWDDSEWDFDLED